VTHARLHLICGNCGCPDDWTWEYCADAILDYDCNPVPDVFIRCGNCSTLHSLSDKAINRKFLIKSGG